MIECSLCTLQNQVMHTVVERSGISSCFAGSIMKLVSHRQALNGLYCTQLKSVHCAHVLLLPPLCYTLMCTTCYPFLFLFLTSQNSRYWLNISLALDPLSAIMTIWRCSSTVHCTVSVVEEEYIIEWTMLGVMTVRAICMKTRLNTLVMSLCGHVYTIVHATKVWSLVHWPTPMHASSASILGHP